jgi:hypothetical protein
LRWRHVIEQDRLGSAGDGLIEFGLGADFDLDPLAAFTVCQGAFENGGNAAAE